MQADSRRLLALCFGYFATYTVTGVGVKYFLGPEDRGFPGLSDMTYLVYSTAGGNLLCLSVVAALGWWRLGPTDDPARRRRELGFMGLSGLCTAVVVPTTTLLYSLPISVMVAMVIMRGSIIVISRLVDVVQSWQGLLRKRVLWEENLAVGFALLAVAVHLLAADAHFDFVGDPIAMGILVSYLLAYAVRLYLMNWFKNTRVPGVPGPDNRAWFAWEQLVASAGILALAVTAGVLAGETGPAAEVRDAVIAAPSVWPWALLSGGVYGVVAFFSVFIFMFQGRSATFAGLVNRLTSLIAGTAATLLSWVFFGFSPPKVQDWVSLGLILVAVALLTRAERRRTAA